MSGAHNCQDCYTVSGHLVGMLDRDQRTVINMRRQSTSELLDTCPGYGSSTFSENSHSSQRKPRPASVANPRMQKVKKVLAVVTYLLIVIPTALSAPSGHRSMEPETDPFWVLNENVLPEENISQAMKDQIARTLLTQATIAGNRANHSLEEFTKHHFDMTPQQVHQRYNGTTFQWLPSQEDIPKQFGQDVVDGFDRTMDQEMVHLYEQFQKIGVGIEQIIKEYTAKPPNGGDDKFADYFKTIRQDLTALLRELNTHIGTLGLSRRPDVPRDSMPDEDRNVDETARRIRNWAIYRDYINALEYTIQSLQWHL